jgi:hypothetical protein
VTLAVLCPAHVRVPPAATFGRSEPRVEVVSNPDGSASPATVRSLIVAVPVLRIDEIVCLSGGGPEALDEHQVARHAARILRARYRGPSRSAPPTPMPARRPSSC